MTKAEIISYVKNGLKKIDKTNKYHDRVLEAAITLAFNQGYSDIFDNDRRSLDNYIKSYGDSGTPIAITTNSNTSIDESVIPEEYVPFSDKNSGVRTIRPVTGTGVDLTTIFYPVTKKEAEQLPSTLVGELNANDVRCYYTVLGEKIEYFGVTSAIKTAGVRMDLIIPFDAYTSDEVIKIPFAKDMQLVTAVIEILRTTPAVDLKDDNADIE
jgi:hypothetical protein